MGSAPEAVQNSVRIIGDVGRASSFIGAALGKKPLFVCTISYTKTAEIRGITVAGANPELVKYTPAADAELIYYGECRSTQAIPATPDGKPTPALITLAALRLGETPSLIVDAGAAVKPQMPYVSFGVPEAGGDIRLGKAMEKEVVRRTLEYGRLLGEQLSHICDYLVLGESIPGGTTTALGVLMALGIDARGKVSSSMPNNPHELKSRVVEEGMKAAGVQLGSLTGDPIGAVAALGDPMMPAVTGMAIGASRSVPVMLAGGTQMAAILALIRRLSPTSLDRLVVATTRYIVDDPTSDVAWLVGQAADVPILAVDVGLSASSKAGLRAYAEGFVKEGVGAGGASLAAILSSRGRVTRDALLAQVERAYEEVVERSLDQASVKL